MKYLSTFLFISLCSVSVPSTASDCEEYETQIQRLDEFLRTHGDQHTFSRDMSEYTAIENSVNERRNKVIAKLKSEGRSVNPMLYRIVGKSKDSWASARRVLQLSELLRTHGDQHTFSRDMSEYTAIENSVNERRNKVIAKLKSEGRSVNPMLYRIVGKSKDSWASARRVLQLSEPLMQSRLRILEAELRLVTSDSEGNGSLLAEAPSLLDEGLQNLVQASFEANRQARITFELLMYLSTCGDLS